VKKKAKVRGKPASIAAAKGHTNGGKTAHPAVSQSLSLLSEISQEITSVLDRDELFGRIADRVKKVVDYHLFSVMLWKGKVHATRNRFFRALRRTDSSAVSRTALQGHHRPRSR
jgi:hypothetical protein